MPRIVWTICLSVVVLGMGFMTSEIMRLINPRFSLLDAYPTALDREFQLGFLTSFYNTEYLRGEEDCAPLLAYAKPENYFQSQLAYWDVKAEEIGATKDELYCAGFLPIGDLSS